VADPQVVAPTIEPGPDVTDVWEAGNKYEPYVGRWSRLVAREFLSWLSVPSDSDWLDVGCGTGALTQTIVDRAAPRTVRSIDPSSGFVTFARHQIPDPRVTFTVADARSIPIGDAQVDAAVSGLVINFVPDPSLAISEMTRIARPGGIVSAYVWDYAGKMELMRYFWDSAVALDPEASDLDEGPRFPICSEVALHQLFAGEGLEHVEVRAVDIATRFRDFDDYWSPFLGGQGPAPAYAMSLDEERRDALRERLRSDLPVSADGSIDLVARAWAAKGFAPLR
jgi:SAM-dependent methyltransferase